MIKNNDKVFFLIPQIKPWYKKEIYKKKHLDKKFISHYTINYGIVTSIHTKKVNKTAEKKLYSINKLIPRGGEAGYGVLYEQHEVYETFDKASKFCSKFLLEKEIKNIK